MRLGIGGALCAAACVLAVACGSSEEKADRACVPGASQSCAGPLGCDGYQVCNDEGSGFEPCMCGSGAASGSSGAGGGGGGGASDGAGGSGTNGGGDFAATVGPVTSATSSGSEDSTTGGGSGGEGGASTTDGTGGTTATGGAGGSATTGGGTGGTGNDCSVEPTVMLLIDASTSMWDNQFWEPLRDAVLGAVEELDGEVRFGFATFGGLPGDTCPLELNTVAIGLENYGEIADFYNAIEHPGTVSETPTAAALYTVGQSLMSLPNASRKAILLVTDGNPDYCDSGASESRADVTVRVLQDVAAAGIPTFVASLPDPGIDQDWLTAMANAGQGQSVSAPRETEFCDDIPAATAAILEGIDPSDWPSATYGETMGPVAPLGLSDTDDVEGMTALLVDAISDWASCE